MTAVVGILNKSAIALAADSAVTVTFGNDRKILNRANKIFTLSKYEPVGVMIYNSASLMATPWEIILKVFRDELGTKAFPHLSDYLDAFLKEKKFYSTPEVQQEFATMLFSNFFNILNNQVFPNPKINLSQLEQQEAIKRIEQCIGVFIEKIKSNPMELTPDFIDFTYEEFNTSFCAASFDTAYKLVYSIYGIELSVEYKDLLKMLAFENFKSTEFFSSYTGLVFAGYGQQEIFPRLLSLHVSNAVGERLRYYIDDSEGQTISEMNFSAICPFAQQDVIETILLGIDPNLNDLYLENLHKFLSDYNESIAQVIKTNNPELSKLILNLDIHEIVGKFAAQNQEIQTKRHLQPLLNAVASLSKEDLAEMAESLIYLTYLKRRMTNAEESVGGPVDVALISKGDGFIWIKRKHYFKPELNQPFFANYLKSYEL
jgi:hypothetical protein